MRTIETNLYQYSELSDKAKARARDWYREASHDDTFFAECVIDDAKEIGALFGLDIDEVYWSGFYSQGDGACIVGSYRYKKGALQAVKKYAPLDTELHAIVAAFTQLQRRHFYSLTASIKHRGHYYHERSMVVDCEDKNGYCEAETDSELRDCLADFASWIYKQLEKEYEYQNSDEVIDELLVSNGYTFTENGERED